MLTAYFITLLLTARHGQHVRPRPQGPAKLRLDAATWIGVQHTLYREFGRTGAIVEVAAVVAACGSSARGR
jgi:hypothetical protein